MMLTRKLAALAFLALSLVACDSPEEKVSKYIERGNKLFQEGQFIKAKLEYKNAARIMPTDANTRYRLALVDEAQGDLQNAIANFLAAEQQNARFEPVVFKLAQYFLAAEQYDEARKRIDILLEDSPQHAGAHALRGALLLRLKNIGLAEKEVQLAFKYDPSVVLGFSTMAGIYVAQNNNEKAVALLDEGITKNPDEISLLFLKAMIYGKMDDVAKIAETYQSIFKLRPKDVAYRFELAEILVKAKKIDEAEATLRAAVAAFPDEWGVKHRLILFLNKERDLKTAEAEIRALAKDAPKQDELYFWLADLYLQHNAVEQAVSLLEEIVSKDADEETGLNARTSLAHIRFLQGNKELAQKLVELVLKKDPNNIDALFVRARLSFAAGDYQHAVSDLRTLIRNKPSTPRALQLLAETYLNQRHLDLAIDTLNQLLAINITDLKARIRLAQMHGLQGDYKRALEMLSIVTKSDPSYPVGWESTARIAIEAKNWSLAEEAIAKLDALDGQHLTASFLKAQVLGSTQKKEEAFTLYKKVIDADPSAPLAEHAFSALVKVASDLNKLPETSAYIAGLKTESGVVASILAETYLATGKIKEAADAFDLAIERKAPFQDPFLNRAKIFMSEKKPDEAVDVLRKAQSADPGDIRATLMMADILTSQSKSQEATALYEALLAKDPAIDVAANNMAQIIADYQGDNSAALEKARRVAERFMGSTNPYFLDTLGWVYFKQGKEEQALPLLQRAMSLVKTAPPQMQYHYGALLMRMGKTEEAKEPLSKAVVEGANYPGIDEAKALFSKLK